MVMQKSACGKCFDQFIYPYIWYKVKKANFIRFSSNALGKARGVLKTILAMNSKVGKKELCINFHMITCIPDRLLTNILRLRHSVHLI